jgi:hypothetical protein
LRAVAAPEISGSRIYFSVTCPRTRIPGTCEQLRVLPAFCTKCTLVQTGRREILFPKVTRLCATPADHSTISIESTTCNIQFVFNTGKRNAPLVTSYSHVCRC